MRPTAIAMAFCICTSHATGNGINLGMPFKEDLFLKTSSRSYRFKPAELAAAGLNITKNTYEEIAVLIDWKTGMPRGGRWQHFYQDGEDFRVDDVVIHLSTKDRRMDRGPDDQFIHSQYPTEVPSWVPGFRQLEAKVVPWWRDSERMYYIPYENAWLAFTCSKFPENLNVCESNSQWDGDKWFTIEMQEKLLPQWREVFRASLEWVERHAIR